MARAYKPEPGGGQARGEGLEGYQQDNTLDFRPQEIMFRGYPNLNTMLGKTIHIKDVEWQDLNKGRVYYVHAREGSFYTWSQVVGRQLEEIKKMIDEKKITVRAKVQKVRNYLTLGDPNV